MDFALFDRDLYHAGHHSVFQHTHLTFAISKVSRHCVTSFLHAHPFYNSSQASQRYTAVGADSYHLAAMGDEAQGIYRETVEGLVSAYEALVEMLTPRVAAQFRERFPERNPEKWRQTIAGKAMEAARYVLPIGMHTHLYHTIPLLTLFRYRHAVQMCDAREETALLVDAMWQEVERRAPGIEGLFDEVMHESEFAENFVDCPRPDMRCEEFDRELDDCTVRLVLPTGPMNERIVAEAMRDVLGVDRASATDRELLMWVLDPAQNRPAGMTLNTGMHSPLLRCLSHARYTFQKALSHAAFSQEQRHRTLAATGPCLDVTAPWIPDFVVPDIIGSDPELLKVYENAMQVAWAGIQRLHDYVDALSGYVYLLPNATRLRFWESGSYLDFRHKARMRLCLNAQEEIRESTREEAEAIRSVDPVLGAYLLTPCEARNKAGLTPPCPEGRRYCGVPVRAG